MRTDAQTDRSDAVRDAYLHRLENAWKPAPRHDAAGVLLSRPRSPKETIVAAPHMHRGDQAVSDALDAHRRRQEAR